MQKATSQNYLYLYFHNLYGSARKLPGSFNFKVDERLALGRKNGFDQGQVVAIASPASASRALRKNNEDKDARLRLMTYLYLCSLVTWTRAQNLWFSWEYQSPQEYFAEAEDNNSDAATLRYRDFSKFLDFSRGLFEKYYDVVRKFDFLKFALGSSFDAGTLALEYSDTSEFIDACISLEALYNEGGSDLKYKLSLRLAFLLGFDGFPPTTTFYNADEIYNRRSSVVHGRGYEPEGEYLEQTKSYARRSCICFLILCRNRINQLSNKQSKCKLLKEIDQAMLDRNKRRELEQEIVKGIAKDFKPNFRERRDESQPRKRDLSEQKKS